MQSLKSKALSVCAAAAVAVLSGPVSAELETAVALKNADVNNGKKIFFEGKGDVPACSSCHGQKGLGNDAMGTPRLAQQGFTYIVKQLEDFAADKRQDTTMFVMNANAKGLSDQDKRDVAAFLYHWEDAEPEPSNLEEVKELGKTVGKPYLGMAIVKYGKPERDVPACRACHQYNGRGSFPVYPQLAQQRYVYLVNQLKKWRDGSRANDPLSQMQKVAQQMTDDDIYNVASFLTGAPMSTEGNTYHLHQEIP